MRGNNARKKKQALNGWVKWSLVLAMPFGVLLTDTFLNLRMWSTDYQVGKLKRDLRSLQAQLKGVQSDEAQLQDLDKLNEQSLELAMVNPGPQQFIEVAGMPRALQAPAPMAAPQPMAAPLSAELVIAAEKQGQDPGSQALQQLATVSAPDFLGEELRPRVDAAIQYAQPVVQAVAATATDELSDVLQRVRTATSAPEVPAGAIAAVLPAAIPAVPGVSAAPEDSIVIQELDLLVPLELETEGIEGVVGAEEAALQSRPAQPAPAVRAPAPAVPARAPAVRTPSPATATELDADPALMLESL